MRVQEVTTCDVDVRALTTVLHDLLKKCGISMSEHCRFVVITIGWSEWLLTEVLPCEQLPVPSIRLKRVFAM